MGKEMITIPVSEYERLKAKANYAEELHNEKMFSLKQQMQTMQLESMIGNIAISTGEIVSQMNKDYEDYRKEFKL